MAEPTVNRGTPPAKLMRADKIDPLAYAAGALLIAFLPNMLACCGVIS